MHKTAIIGLGVIGSAVLREIAKKIPVTGIDIDVQKIATLKKQGFDVEEKLTEPYDVYIICTYSSESVLEIAEKLDYSKKPLISVESTLKPGAHQKLTEIVVKRNNSNLILFPHRLNPNDPDHYVFNLHRVMAGATSECLKRGLKFYTQFMPRGFIITTDLKHAELSKIAENAHRFLEIAWAEEVKMLCDKYGYDFKELRKLMNTKWNIDLKEARNGICGICLPKDSDFFSRYFKRNKFIKCAKKADIEYQKHVQNLECGIKNRKQNRIFSKLFRFANTVKFGDSRK